MSASAESVQQMLPLVNEHNSTPWPPTVQDILYTVQDGSPVQDTPPASVQDVSPLQEWSPVLDTPPLPVQDVSPVQDDEIVLGHMVPNNPTKSTDPVDDASSDSEVEITNIKVVSDSSDDEDPIVLQDLVPLSQKAPICIIDSDDDDLTVQAGPAPATQQAQLCIIDSDCETWVTMEQPQHSKKKKVYKSRKIRNGAAAAAKTARGKNYTYEQAIVKGWWEQVGYLRITKERFGKSGPSYLVCYDSEPDSDGPPKVGFLWITRADLLALVKTLKGCNILEKWQKVKSL